MTMVSAENFILHADSPVLAEYRSRVSNAADYFGIWSIYADHFRAMADQFNGMDLTVHVGSDEAMQAVRQRDASQRRPFELTDDGIAVFYALGPMMKSVGSLQDGTSTVRLRQQIRAALKDSAVVGGLLVLDTPGGTVKGNRDLADELARFDQHKPLFAFGEDMVASAGVSIASQARKVFVNNSTALYGAMGTYSVLYDESGAAEKLGVKVHVIKAGEFKGMGEPGTPVTAEQLLEAQRIVTSLNQAYLELIARGRGMDAGSVQAIADGRIHPASEAHRMGLIDGVQTFEATYQQLLDAVASSSSKSRHVQLSLSEQVDADDPKTDEGEKDMPKSVATLAELKTTFPNSTADWRETQLEAEASLQEAAISYAQHVEEKAAKAAEAHQEELAKAKASGGAGLGQQPMTTSNVEGDRDYVGDTGDPIDDFNSKVDGALGNGPRTLKNRFAAIRSVSQRNPELYQAYLLATNPGKKQQRQIAEKLESAAG